MFHWFQSHAHGQRMLRRTKITPAATVVILTVWSASRVSTERIVSIAPPEKKTKLMKMHTPEYHCPIPSQRRRARVRPLCCQTWFVSLAYMYASRVMPDCLFSRGAVSVAAGV
jgi:hypothetical protein